MNMVNEEFQSPSSIGSRADIKSGVNIAEVHGGYFSNQENVKVFIELAISVIEKELPQEAKYADFGGGEGFLTEYVAKYLESQGHLVTAYVIDANEKFLEVAKQKGLLTFKCNLENCKFEGANLVTMRAVNHYNPVERQLEIIRSAFNSIITGGFLVSQVSSGRESNCRLRSDINNLDSLGRAASGENYHWTSIREYTKLLEKAGFKSNEHVGYAPETYQSPEGQWNRFHSKELKEATAAGDKEKIESIEQARKKYLKDAYALVHKYAVKYGEDRVGIAMEGREARIKCEYPIIISRK